jgi:DNA ligase 4
MGETVDALVVGAPSFLLHEAVLTSMLIQAGNYGSGKRGGGVSTLICAVLDDRDAAQTDEEPKYAMVIFII